MTINESSLRTKCTHAKYIKNNQIDLKVWRIIADTLVRRMAGNQVKLIITILFISACCVGPRVSLFSFFEEH